MGRAEFNSPEETEAYLEGKARRQAPAPRPAASRPARAASPARRTSQRGGSLNPAGVARGARQLAGAVPSSGPQVTGILTRLIVATAVALVGLEVASQVSGQYFNFDLKQGAHKLGNAGQYLGLYPGQAAKLETLKATPAAAAHPVPGVVTA